MIIVSNTCYLHRFIMDVVKMKKKTETTGTNEITESLQNSGLELEVSQTRRKKSLKTQLLKEVRVTVKEDGQESKWTDV